MQEFVEMEVWLLLTCFVYQLRYIHCKFHCHILNNKDVWKRWFIKRADDEQLISASFRAKYELLFVFILENPFWYRDFTLKLTELAQVLLKSGIRDFQNSLLFKRFAFCM